MRDERGFLTKPFFIIEVVSSKYSLQIDLCKMKKYWVSAGTQIGIVVCPFRQKYYLFEKDKDEYTELPFSQLFTHDKLPHLEINFADLLEEVQMEDDEA